MKLNEILLYRATRTYVGDFQDLDLIEQNLDTVNPIRNLEKSSILILCTNRMCKKKKETEFV